MTVLHLKKKKKTDEQVEMEILVVGLGHAS